MWGEILALLTILGILGGIAQAYLYNKFMNSVKDLMKDEKEKVETKAIQNLKELEQKIWQSLKESKDEYRKEIDKLQSEIQNVKLEYLNKKEFETFKGEFNASLAQTNKKIDKIEKEIQNDVIGTLSKILQEVQK